MVPRINALPEEVIRQLKSSTAITSLTCVVLGLVQNSIDAEAQNIAIKVNFRRGDCVIEDDGTGIAPADFHEDGGLGKAFFTSKYQLASWKYGYQGMFLASLAALSLVTITSREQGQDTLNEITLHRGTVATRCVPALGQRDLTLSGNGTRVEVRNLFGSMPVRVKLRAGLDERFETEQWDRTSRRLVELLIAWHRPLNIVMHEDLNSKKFTIRGLLPMQSTLMDHSKTAAQPASINPDLILRILSQSGYVEPHTVPSWVPISAKTSSFSIKGLISLDPAPNKQCQYISFGNQPISNVSNQNEVYEEINRIVSTSNFGRASTDSNDHIDNQFQDLLEMQHHSILKQRTGKKKGVERWPKFYLRILFGDLSGHHSDLRCNSPEEQMKLGEILQIITVMITHWLSEYGFNTRTSHFNQSATTPATTLISATERKSMSIRPFPIGRASDGKDVTSEADQRKHAFSSWSRIKSGNSKSRDDKKKYSQLAYSPAAVVPTYSTSFSDSQAPPRTNRSSVIHITAPSSQLKTSSFPSVIFPDSEPQISSQQVNQDESLDNFVSWKPPLTNGEYRLNTRTGLVAPETPTMRFKSRWCNRGASTSTITPELSTIWPSDGRDTVRTSSWLENVLKNWNNPVFPCAQMQIPQNLPTTPCHKQLMNDSYYRCEETSTFFDDVKDYPGSVSSRVSIQGLRGAEIIAQVDRKFILAKLMTDGDTKDNKSSERKKGVDQMLILIDQHAADERCKIESLLSELCQPVNFPESLLSSNLGFRSNVATVRLQKSIRFSTDAREASLFRSQAKFFAKWGIIYDMSTESGTATFQSIETGSVIIVNTLPPGIVERCVQEPKLLIESLRSEVWKRRDGDASFSKPIDWKTDTAEPHLWARLISDCPQSIIEILNSRSCRSAIMFNDDLSLDQSKDLVKRLANCAFPFQCAHGRPSMVPLVELTRATQDLEFNQSSLTEDFRAWRRRLKEKSDLAEQSD